jgi:membrane associated rhomboid family serine protease
MLNNIPPGLRNLLIVIVLFDLARHALPKIGIDFTALFAVYYPDSYIFRPWQLITHMFIHGNFLHLLFNGLALISLGVIVELKLGTRKFLYLFFISGLGAVLVHFMSVAVVLYNATGSIMPLHHGMSQIPKELDDIIKIINTPGLGASGALYGVLIAFVYYFPNERLVFMFIPYPVKAKILIPIILLAYDILLPMLIALNILPKGDFQIAHFAHLGGAITGFVLVKFWAWDRINRRWS